MYKILIVEDDKNYSQAVAQEFSADQYHVITSFDGVQGLTIAKSEIPDLIILDIMLPKMLGITFMENLMNDPKTKHIPVIAITNFGGEANKERALQTGVKEFLVKAEVTTNELAEIGKKYLPKN